MKTPQVSQKDSRQARNLYLRRGRGKEGEIIPQVVGVAGRPVLWLANHDKTAESGGEDDGCVGHRRLCAFSCLLLHNLFEVYVVAVRGGASEAKFSI